MSSTKRRKVSSLSGLELELTLDQLRKFRASMTVEELPESDFTPDDPLPDQLKNFIAVLESRTKEPVTLGSSAADDDVLERLSIVRKGVLYLHSEATFHNAINTTRTIGTEKLWSDENMYNHLVFLASSFANKNGASARMIIDTFFFRSTSMVSSPQKVVVMLESHVSGIQPRKSQTDIISETISYTAVVVESAIAQNYVHFPPASISRNYGNEIMFFVAEAERTATKGLEGDLPRVLRRLVACAKHFRQRHIRGALTTGLIWMFIVVDLDANGDGATYSTSTPIPWWVAVTADQEHIVTPSTTPALIAGILASWIPQSFVEFKGDQWFELHVQREKSENVIGSP